VSTIGDIPQDRHWGNYDLEDNRRRVLSLILVLISQSLYSK